MWQFLSLLAFLAQKVSSHGGAMNYTVGDTWYPGYSPYAPPEGQDGMPWLVQRKWVSINPIFEADNISLACNDPGDPALASIPIRAGQNISAVYYDWLHTVGPMIVWMTPCNGPCSKFNTTNANWFKIAERGLLSGDITDGMWFQHAFQVWDGGPSLWTETIPGNLRPGEYLIRHEIIALHIEHKPQWYPECAHLVVSGNGTAFPSGQYMAKIPGVYNMSQPEINIDVYSAQNRNTTVYKIPGPPVWTGDDSVWTGK